MPNAARSMDLCDSGGALRSSAAGASAVEAVLIVALIALVTIGAMSALGDAIGDKVECAAESIGGSSAARCTAERSDGEAGARSSHATSRTVGTTRGSLRAGALASASAASLTGTNGAIDHRSDPHRSYAARFHDALDLLRDPARFDAIAGSDGRITREELISAERGANDARVRDAAGFLLESAPARNALDVGAGRHDVDGRISLDDVRGLRRDLTSGHRTMAKVLADAARGDGGRDRQWSREDLDALAHVPSVPESVRAWARTATPNATHGCSWWRVDCHLAHVATTVWNAAKSAWHATSWVRHFAQRIGWLLMPPLDPREWGDWAVFRLNVVRGMGDWVVGTAKGLGALGGWLFDPDSELDAHALGAAWRAVSAMPGAMWRSVDRFASGDPAQAGRAGGSLALDAASMFIPVGAGVRAARATRAITALGRSAEASAIESGDTLLAMAAAGQTDAVEQLVARQVTAALADEARARGARLSPDAARSVLEDVEASASAEAWVTVNRESAGLPFDFTISLERRRGTTALTIHRIEGDGASEIFFGSGNAPNPAAANIDTASLGAIERLARAWRVQEIEARTDFYTLQSEQWWLEHGFEQVQSSPREALWRKRSH